MKNKFLLLVMLFTIATPALADSSAEAVSVQVKTKALIKQVLVRKIDAYGSVSAATGAVENVSFPRNIQLVRLLVTPGQVVHSGDALLETVTDAGTSATYQQALSAEALAKSELSRTEDLVTQQLATQSQLAAARKALQDAEAALAAQNKLGAGVSHQVFKAPFDALVASISAQQGDRVQAGAIILQLSRSGALKAILGVEPGDVSQIRVGMRVNISPIFGKQESLQATVTQINGAINAQTRLVDIAVSFKKSSNSLLPGMQVRGQIVIDNKELWTIPSSAVLQDAKGSYLYQVKDQHAQRINVIKSDGDAGNVGVEGDFNTKYKVVIEGNYELQDGMAVREGKL